MASLDAEEALLKKKLENTDNLEDRRELRKQLRELRNRKFEEEIKKVTASDYRPGRTKTALSNGVDSSLSSLGRKESLETKEEGEDVYGINHLGTEEELQALLNETPFTETEKRKKIRARIREIRNHKLGLGDPVVIKRATSEEKTKETSSIVEKANDADKRNYSSTVRSNRDVKEEKETERNERTTYSSRGSYRSRQRNEEETYISRSSKRGSDIDNESAGRLTSTTRLKSGVDDNEKSSRIKENEVRIDDDRQVENQSSSDLGAGIRDKEEKEEVKGVGMEDEVGIADEGVEEVEKEDVEDVVEEEGTSYEDKAVNGYGEDRINSLKDDREDDLDSEEDIDSQSRGSASKNYDQLDKKEEIDNQDDAVDEDFVDNDEDAEDEEDLEEDGCDEDGAEDGDDLVEDIVDDEEFSDNDEEDKCGDEDRQHSDIDKRGGGYSAEDADSYVEDEVDDAEPERMEPEPSEQSLKDDEYSDEENQSVEDDDYSSDGEEEGKNESDEEPTSKEGRTIHEYSDDYSEGFSDHTATDEGSSISERKYEDDQDLAGYEFEKQSVERKKTGASYIAKVDEVFKQKEPALAEGKSFKELLKKSDRSSVEKPQGSKRGAEQVDFRTVLRSTEKAKKPGEKSSTVEQVDFRNLLQKKVKTRTLADKDVGAEQVDFRTVLRQASISSEKKEAPVRKSSNAEQLDFRNVLKKQPSIKSRKLSMEDKNELIKSIRAGRDTTNEETAPTEKPGRPSLESLRQGGGVDKAKDELNKNLKEDAENGKAQRKAGRLSLDALKKSGELGKTEDKKGVFEKTSKAKKAPSAVPPKPSTKGRVSATSENDELEVIEEPEFIEEVEQEPNDDRNAVESSVSKPEKTVVEVSSKEAVPRKASIEISSKESVEKKSQKASVQVTSTANVEKSRSRRKNELPAKSEAGKEDLQSRRIPQDGDEKRSPTKSGDKRARNRRLRQDQNEAVQAQGEEVKSEKKEVKKIAETKQKSSSIERVSTVQSTSSKPTMQVIVSAKGNTEKSKADDSDEESIGARRNRRRLVRKESVEEEDEEDSGRVSGRAATKKDQPAEEKKSVEREERKGSSTGSNVGTDDSGKTSRVSARRDAGHSLRTKTESEKSKETETDASKSRKAKTTSLDAKLMERRRQRAMESREKKQQARNSRKAFKDQLESSAPTTNGSASPSIQRANSNMTKLLHWCQRMTDGYPNVSVTNFTTSWKDGLAFCALLHNFVPDKIPFDDLTAKRPRESFELAFSAAAEEGVPQLLEVDDMVRMECPDPKSVITYIHSIYQEFVTNRR